MTWGAQRDSNESQGIGKVDYQWSANHTLFGRYMRTSVDELPVWEPGGNILTTSTAGGDRNDPRRVVHARRNGRARAEHGERHSGWRTTERRCDPLREPFVDAPSLGVNAFTYFPGKLTMTVTGGFNIGQADSIRSVLTPMRFKWPTISRSSVAATRCASGANLAYWTSESELNARSGGLWQFNGSQTGLGLADFLAGRLFRLEQGAPNVLPIDQTYLGVYAQDAWSATSTA